MKHGVEDLYPTINGETRAAIRLSEPEDALVEIQHVTYRCIIALIEQQLTEGASTKD